MKLLLRVAVMEQKERNKVGTYLLSDLQVQMTDLILLRGQGGEHVRSENMISEGCVAQRIGDL